MQYGIRSITMDEIAAQLGISKKTIYQFFTDKDAMVEAVVNEVISRNEEDCRGFTHTAENAVHEIFIAMDFTQEMMKAMRVTAAMPAPIHISIKGAMATIGTVWRRSV